VGAVQRVLDVLGPERRLALPEPRFEKIVVHRLALAPFLRGESLTTWRGQDKGRAMRGMCPGQRALARGDQMAASTRSMSAASPSGVTSCRNMAAMPRRGVIR